MATFISISGPSTSGKTSLVNSLSTYQELRGKIFSPDMREVVWNELVSLKYFNEFTEISTDTDYLCTYIVRVVDYYNNYIKSYMNRDVVVILDSCWIDLSIYAMLQMWYTKIIKDVQESILYNINKFDESISRIYFTKVDDESYPPDKFRMRGKISSFRENRPLELRYYDVFHHMKNGVVLPSSDVDESSFFIVNDLMKLGYL